MDLNSDGNIDVLSGSYSRMEGSMAGLFYVLWGEEGGKFKKAQPLTSDGEEPLVISVTTDVDETGDVRQICTRPFACDIDGDGVLDIVTGNFGGTFAVFEGLGDGQFAEDSTWLSDTAGKPLQVDAHSDPYLVDWDKDGDLDLLSGSSDGSVTLFTNGGTKTEPKFGKKTVLLEAASMDYGSEEVTLGDAHLVRPQSSTRISVTDVNGDGKLDLLVGDSLDLLFPVDGLDEAEVRERFLKWQEELTQLDDSYPEVNWGDDGELSDEDQKALDAFYKRSETLMEKRSKFLTVQSTGSVWLLVQK